MLSYQYRDSHSKAGIAWLCTFSLFRYSNAKSHTNYPFSLFNIEGGAIWEKGHIDTRQSGYPWYKDYIFSLSYLYNGNAHILLDFFLYWHRALANIGPDNGFYLTTPSHYPTRKNVNLSTINPAKWRPLCVLLCWNIVFQHKVNFCVDVEGMPVSDNLCQIWK